MTIPRPWLEARYALVHGEDSDGRGEAVAGWKAVHVDPEWEVFSFTVCAEGCPWPEVLNALCESAPLGADRVVLVPQADNLLEKAKELPSAVKQTLQSPLPGTRLLLVARGALSAGPGKILGAKPFSEWNQQGRVLKVGALDPKEAAAWIQDAASGLGLRLDSGVAARIAARMGGNPGILRRTLEVLDLLADGRSVSLDQVDQATFRLGEQNAFAWTKAWQGGQIALALQALRGFPAGRLRAGAGPDRPRGRPAAARPGQPDRSGPQGPGHRPQRDPAAEPHHGVLPGLGQLSKPLSFSAFGSNLMK